jgi:hypothetical protein
MTGLGMAQIAVSILRWVDDAPQPGLIEFCLVDGSGKDWRFIDKQAIASADFLDAHAEFPRQGRIRCAILALAKDSARIDTDIPWGVVSIDGTHVFEVQAERLDRNVPQLDTAATAAGAVIETIILTAEKRK